MRLIVAGQADQTRCDIVTYHEGVLVFPVATVTRNHVRDLFRHKDCTNAGVPIP